MREDFLHTIWEQQLFQKGSQLYSGLDQIFVLKTGFRNSDAGPDFNQAKIIMADLEWIGSIEIHVRASEWNEHKHQFDEAYQSVILHVVYEKDIDVYRLDGTLVPCLELQNLIPLDVLLKYRSMLQVEKNAIPCSAFLPSVKPFVVISMQERVLVERLERKANDILERFEANKKDWLQTFFQTIAWSLGLRVNAEPMLVLSQSVTTKILAAQGWQTEKMAAILLGQAGYLDKIFGPAGEKLKTEYAFISQKYALIQPPVIWKLFRLRPGAFPIQRLILLAIISSHLTHWFQLLTEAEDSQDFFSHIEKSSKSDLLSTFLLENGYEKYDFSISKFLRENLIVNVFTPFLTALSLHQNQKEQIEKAMDWLNKLGPEENVISRSWKNMGMVIHSAGESQAFTELYNNYCQKRKCMNCQIGISIIKTG